MVGAGEERRLPGRGSQPWGSRICTPTGTTGQWLCSGGLLRSRAESCWQSGRQGVCGWLWQRGGESFLFSRLTLTGP